jgi:chitinase
MSSSWGSSAPPPVPYNTRPQMNAPRRPSQPSLNASLSDLTRKNAVYYPNYRVYRGETPASLNYNCISHVFYAFAHVSPDGGVFVSGAPTYNLDPLTL